MNALALDIGGANLKAASIDAGGGLIASSYPFALWKTPHELAARLTQIAGDFPRYDGLLVTMTAELCDCFETHREGVNLVLDACEAIAARRPVHVWSTGGAFLTTPQARHNPHAVAAANWHALATSLARRDPVRETLLVDTGTTTTDIIPLIAGRPAARGLTDTTRLAHHELVYTGSRRTPLMALASHVTLRGVPHGVMAEYFANAGDVHVLLGDLPEDPGDRDTADGRPLTKPYAAARVLRMVGADLETHTLGDAISLAAEFARLQHQHIRDAVKHVARRHPTLDRAIVSGSGSFLARRALADALPGVETTDLADFIGRAASDAACAAALLDLADVTRQIT